LRKLVEEHKTSDIDTDWTLNLWQCICVYIILLQFQVLDSELAFYLVSYMSLSIKN
jgi:hypothetical protein